LQFRLQPPLFVSVRNILLLNIGGLYFVKSNGERMAEAKGQASSVVSEVLRNVIDALGGDPCILAILIIVIASFALIVYAYRHQERMEKLRLKQVADILKGQRK